MFKYKGKFCFKLKNNVKIIESYVSLTIILMLNSFFMLLIYPYIIKKLGQNSYGLYIFINSIVNYFIQFVSYGFDMYGVREIASNKNNKNAHIRTLSIVFTSKLYLLIIAIFLYIILIFNVEVMFNNVWLSISIFGSILVNIFFPIWYFQGIENMKTVTFIQLIFKLSSLPFIFWLVKTPNDIVVFSVIMTLSNLLGAVSAYLYIYIKLNIHFCIVNFKETIIYLKEAFYFFCTNMVAISKVQIPNIIIGSKFGMSDLAIWDLAQKIVLIPFMIWLNINKALFPKIINKFEVGIIKKIIVAEGILGMLSILVIVMFGTNVIEILGNKGMGGAYLLAVILSITILTYLISSVYIELILIPKGMDKYVFRDQFYSTLYVITLLIIGLLINKQLYMLPISLAVAGLLEMFYLISVVKKYKLIRQ